MCNVWTSHSKINQTPNNNSIKVELIKGIPSDREYRTLVSRRISIILLSISRACSNRLAILITLSLTRSN